MIRCLIVDDSLAFREVLKRLLTADRQVEIVGEAADGQEAVAKATELRPDVVTMDVRMPGTSGIDAIRTIMRRAPVPIVVLSASAADAEVSFRAVEAGAAALLEKPRGYDLTVFAQQAEELRSTVRAVAGRAPAADDAPSPGSAWPVPARSPPARRWLDDARRGTSCLGIVASTGGPAALAQILSRLPSTFPVPIVVVQHIADGFLGGLVVWLGGLCALEVKRAEAGEAPRPGTVLLAPCGSHLTISLGRARLDDGPPVQGFRPAGTVLLASLAKEYGRAAAGVVLTGMGRDGAAGLKMIHDAGGFTLAQGPKSSVVYGMPRAAVECGAAGRVVELEQIPAELLRACTPGARTPTSSP